MLSAGKGKYRVWLRELRVGKDIVLLLGGGEKPHIGTIVVAEPGKKAFVFNRKTQKGRAHKEYVVARPIAEKAAAKYKRPVVCIAGIHVENATKEEIGLLVKNCAEIKENI